MGRRSRVPDDRDVKMAALRASEALEKIAVAPWFVLSGSRRLHLARREVTVVAGAVETMCGVRGMAARATTLDLARHNRCRTCQTEGVAVPSMVEVAS